MNLLDVRGISTFYGSVLAIRDVSLTVARGSLVCLIGGNGAGKSTVLKSICGVLHPREGQIIFDGTDVTGWAADRVARAGFALIPQGRQVLGPLTVEENLEMGAFRLSTPEAKKAVEEMFERFPLLSTLRKRPAGLLSGGEQAILALARGLASRPRMLLMDEPSVGLSPKMFDQVFITIKTLTDDGIPILLVEQNARKALAVSSYAYVLQQGRIVQHGPSSELQEDERIAQAYLGY